MSPKKAPTILAPQTRPDLILVHGFRGSPLGLKDIASELQKAGYHVHIPAVPPFGGAEALPEYTPREYAQFLANFIRDHHLNRPILIGHSMGSVVVSATAHYYPELINNKIVLLSPISAKPARFFGTLAPLVNVVPRSIIDHISTRYLFVPHNHVLFKHALKQTRACSDDQPPKRAELKAATKFSTHHSVRDFIPNQKVCIIAGERDRLVRQKDTKKLAEYAQAELVLIPNSGHLHNYEKPHETAEYILNFINQ